MLELKLYIFTWVLAACAYTYSCILTDHGMILFAFRFWLLKKFKSEDNWLFKIIIGCGYCVSGQWALWSFLLISTLQTETFGNVEYNLVLHIVFVLFTIFNYTLIRKAGIYE